MPISTAELSWRVLGFVNGLRLLASSALTALFVSIMPETIGQLDPALFAGAATAYFLYAVISVGSIRRRTPEIVLQAWTGAFADVLVLSLLTYASGGVNGGIAVLVVLSMGAASFILRRKLAMAIALSAAGAMLVQPGISLFASTDAMGDFTTAAISGALTIVIALGISQLARVMRQNEEIVRQREAANNDLSELHRSLARHLREGVLMVDAENKISLISDTAALSLQSGSVSVGSTLSDVSPRLANLVDTWRRFSCDESRSTPTMMAYDGERRLQLKFVSLDNSTHGPAVIFAEDKSRAPTWLAASMVPASVQVNEVSDGTAGEEDYRSNTLRENLARQNLFRAALQEISPWENPKPVPKEAKSPASALPAAASRHSQPQPVRPPGSMLTNNDPRLRIIIGHALQLGRRDSLRLERVDLTAWSKEFLTEYWQTEDLDADTLRLTVPRETVSVRADPGHLHELLWMLCSDLLRYGRASNATDPVEIRVGRSAKTQRRYLDVIDRGSAIGPVDSKRVFEPFLSVGTAGTGIAMLVSRELSPGVRSGANNDPRPGGGVVFRLVFADAPAPKPAEPAE